MACALFASHIILSVPRPETRKFGVLAIIATTRAKVENVDEKPGLLTPCSKTYLKKNTTLTPEQGCNVREHLIPGSCYMLPVAIPLSSS